MTNLLKCNWCKQHQVLQYHAKQKLSCCSDGCETLHKLTIKVRVGQFPKLVLGKFFIYGCILYVDGNWILQRSNWPLRLPNSVK